MNYLEEFKNIDNSMLWKQSALNQITEFENLASRLKTIAFVPATHQSKSIRLPVVKFVIGQSCFFLRDNFHDVNLCVVSGKPIELSLSEILEDVCIKLDWDLYIKEIGICRGYSWKEWTDEQINDINCLSVKSPNGYEWKKSKEEKKRWLNRYKNPDWYQSDWSSGSISWEGQFGPGVDMFIQHHPFAQGIEELVHSDCLKPYKKGAQVFTLAVENIAKAEKIIKKIMT